MNEGGAPLALIVEDDTEMALCIQRFLERKFSAHADTAADLQAATARLEVGSYEVILLDYQLPDGNGVDLLDLIVSRDDHPRVVMLTGCLDNGLRPRALSHGALAYVFKDTKRFINLATAVENALEGSKAA